MVISRNSAAANLDLVYNRVKPFIHLTPIVQSQTLNNMLGHSLFFKADSLQKTGAFKVRGVLNHLLKLKEIGKLPSQVVAYSTGNHGIGLSYVAKILGLKARIYLPQNVSHLKQQAARYYGAEVISTATRQDAENMARSDGQNGFYYLHPSDSDSTIAGAATMCYEALMQLDDSPDAIFASCGGGGLLSGSYLAKELLSSRSLLIGSEPTSANDAFLSIKQGKIFKFTESPDTIADGLRTLAVSDRTFEYLKKLDEFILAEEREICYWNAWLTHLLKISCEPSCALNMVAVIDWLRRQKTQKKVLILISGGNIDLSAQQKLYENKHFLTIPSLISV